MRSFTSLEESGFGYVVNRPRIFGSFVSLAWWRLAWYHRLNHVLEWLYLHRLVSQSLSPIMQCESVVHPSLFSEINNSPPRRAREVSLPSRYATLLFLLHNYVVSEVIAMDNPIIPCRVKQVEEDENESTSLRNWNACPSYVENHFTMNLAIRFLSSKCVYYWKRCIFSFSCLAITPFYFSNFSINLRILERK